MWQRRPESWVSLEAPLNLLTRCLASLLVFCQVLSPPSQSPANLPIPPLPWEPPSQGSGSIYTGYPYELNGRWLPGVDDEMIETLLATLLLFSYPEHITVRVTGQHHCTPGMTYHIEEVDFQDYVKGVMMAEFANGRLVYGQQGIREWIPLTQEALRAQAVIIKNFALHSYHSGGKWGGYEHGIVYDCDWDMVYGPNIRQDATDQAVEDTWDWLLVYEGSNELVPTYFNAWSNGCLITHGKHGVCASAWDGIYRQSDAGWSTEQMLAYAYHNTTVVTRGEVLDQLIALMLYKME